MIAFIESLKDDTCTPKPAKLNAWVDNRSEVQSSIKWFNCDGEAKAQSQKKLEIKESFVLVRCHGKIENPVAWSFLAC